MIQCTNVKSNAVFVHISSDRDAWDFLSGLFEENFPHAQRIGSQGSIKLHTTTAIKTLLSQTKHNDLQQSSWWKEHSLFSFEDGKSHEQSNPKLTNFKGWVGVSSSPNVYF